MTIYSITVTHYRQAVPVYYSICTTHKSSAWHDISAIIVSLSGFLNPLEVLTPHVYELPNVDTLAKLYLY